MSTVPNPSTDDRPAYLTVADGHRVYSCCGRVDDEPHRNFCPHYVAGDGYAEGYLDALDAAKRIRDERRRTAEALECPEWCVVDHEAEDDPRDDVQLHQGADHADGIVRKLLDAHQLSVQVTRADDLDAGQAGVPSLYVRCEVELTSWEQAAELARTILDGFGYLEGAR